MKVERITDPEDHESPRAWMLHGRGPSPWNSQTKIDELPLLTRTRNSLRRAGHRTLGEVFALDDLDLRDIREFGGGSIRDLRRALYPNPQMPPVQESCAVPGCNGQQEPDGIVCLDHFLKLANGGPDAAAKLQRAIGEATSKDPARAA